jgi:hypothetical protein
VNLPTLTMRCVSTPMRWSDGLWATGETMRAPESSKPMKPRSNCHLRIDLALGAVLSATNLNATGWHLQVEPSGMS